MRGVLRAICCEMQHSASATAKPPSLQSCALLIAPEWISARKRKVQVLFLFEIAARWGPGFKP